MRADILSLYGASERRANTRSRGQRILESSSYSRILITPLVYCYSATEHLPDSKLYVGSCAAQTSAAAVLPLILAKMMCSYSAGCCSPLYVYLRASWQLWILPLFLRTYYCWRAALLAATYRHTQQVYTHTRAGRSVRLLSLSLFLPIWLQMSVCPRCRDGGVRPSFSLAAARSGRETVYIFSVAAAAAAAGSSSLPPSSEKNVLLAASSASSRGTTLI